MPATDNSEMLTSSENENSESQIFEMKSESRPTQKLDLTGQTVPLERTLTHDEARKFVAMQLAGFATVKEATEAVNREFTALDSAVSLGQVAYIRQQVQRPDEELKEPWLSLKRHFRRCRERFNLDLENVPIAHRRVRLEQLQMLYNEATEAGEELVQVPVRDPRTHKQMKDDNGRPIYRYETKAHKKDIATAAAILKQAAQEKGDWKETVEHRTPDWTAKIKELRKKRGLKD